MYTREAYLPHIAGCKINRGIHMVVKGHDDFSRIRDRFRHGDTLGAQYNSAVRQIRGMQDKKRMSIFLLFRT